MAFSSATKWIWVEKQSKPDTYGEFYSEFVWENGNVNCLLSCDGDYTLFINGKYVSSNQYGDFEWYKSYDNIDITKFLKHGKNSVAILVWHFGVGSLRYLNAKAGLIFEIKSKDRVLLASGENVLSRYSKAYKQGLQKLVTRQLGFSFYYDATKEDGWLTDGKGFNKSVIVEKECNFVARPNAKLQSVEHADCKIIIKDVNRYLVDLGEEMVGLPTFKLNSSEEQLITIAWGEDLQDGHVRKNIEHRDFSFDYVAKKGVNEYTNYMLRLGCRYLEIFAQKPIEIVKMGIIKQVYPVKERLVKLGNELDQKIYDACVNSLKLCMLEHYVDTPWREQSLYVYDSKNQALCGYYAFEDANVDYVRSNLKLISQDRRKDGLLAICYPCGIDLTIPSFSLYYFVQVNEYLKYTGDKLLGLEVYDKLTSILNVFINNRKDGLVLRFEGVNHWNFYDWSTYLDGDFVEKTIPDLMINLLFIFALANFKEISQTLEKPFEYEEILNESKVAVRERFFSLKQGLFSMTVGGDEYTVLGNSLAILLSLVSEEESQSICEKIVNGELHDCSLSMKIFKYQALLETDKTKWRDWVFGEIRREYGKMLENGNTVWETIDGAIAFDNAGSLCHGWSAIPIYFYLNEKYN